MSHTVSRYQQAPIVTSSEDDAREMAGGQYLCSVCGLNIDSRDCAVTEDWRSNGRDFAVRCRKCTLEWATEKPLTVPVHPAWCAGECAWPKPHLIRDHERFLRHRLP
jgi:hypothetical protein